MVDRGKNLKTRVDSQRRKIRNLFQPQATTKGLDVEEYISVYIEEGVLVGKLVPSREVKPIRHGEGRLGSCRVSLQAARTYSSAVSQACTQRTHSSQGIWTKLSRT